jgi:UDP-glucose 4-epimerase
VRRALITGGAGFIGSHLSEALLERGDEVFVVDNMSTGRYDNIRHLRDDDRFHLTVSSILDSPTLSPLVERADLVFHLAAAVGVEKIIKTPVDTIETNILGSHSVLTLAARYNKLCLLASTSEVYGKATKVPFVEDDDSVLGPTTKSRWSYACSKAVDEFLALAYHHERGLPVIIVRLFNTTGPRQTGRYGMVLPRFVDQALNAESLTVFGSGEQSRCFADVSDVIKGLLALVEHPGAVGEVFNIGNPEEISINDLARKVKSIVGSGSDIRYVPYDRAYEPGFEDMERRVPSIAKITQLVGYKPVVKLDETIRRLVEYNRKARAAQDRLVSFAG